MSKEKQIEEMWNIITTDCNRECDGCEFENDEWCFTRRVVKELYNAGYRKQEWISVEERLPEASGAYIVCRFDGYVYKTFFSGTFPKVITHWMPLPEAPNMQREVRV